MKQSWYGRRDASYELCALSNSPSNFYPGSAETSPGCTQRAGFHPKHGSKQASAPAATADTLDGMLALSEQYLTGCQSCEHQKEHMSCKGTNVSWAVFHFRFPLSCMLGLWLVTVLWLHSSVCNKRL